MGKGVGGGTRAGVTLGPMSVGLSPDEIDTAIARIPLSLDAYAPVMRADAERALRAFLTAPAPEPTAADKIVNTGILPLPDTAPALIGLAGFARHGKDEAAKHVASRFASVANFAFSDPIIDEVNDYLHPLGRRLTQGNKADPLNRHLLQIWGSGRRAERADYWDDAVGRRIDELSGSHRLVFVTGIRAPEDPDTGLINFHDLEIVERAGGTVWCVERPGLAKSEAQEHPNDRGLRRVPRDRFGAWLMNAEDDLSVLHGNVERALGIES